MQVYDSLVTKHHKTLNAPSNGGMDIIDYGKRAATEQEMAETTVMTAHSSSTRLQDQECGNQSLTLQIDNVMTQRRWTFRLIIMRISRLIIGGQLIRSRVALMCGYIWETLCKGKSV